MTSINTKVLAFSVAIIAFSSVNTTIAQEKTFMESMKEGKASLSFRFRIEDVSQETNDGATATTLKTRLNYSTGAYNGFSGFIEFDQVSELIEVDYNTGPGGATYENKAAILDPEGTDLNQAYAQYTYKENTVKYGRQRILLDNQRFVGGVGFRQNEQTYDATSYSGKFSKVTVFGAYITNVNRIFGDERYPAGDNYNSTTLLNANFALAKPANITAYAYQIDNDSLIAFSTNTLGVRFSGDAKSFNYAAEFATQTDAGKNTADYSASFLALEGAYSIRQIKLTLGYQSLGADGTNGYFITPLATLHKFQGWTDMFLNGGRGNIAGGIEDLYGSVGGKFGPINASIIYHQFSANDVDAANGAEDYGSEIGLVVSGKAGPVGLTAKYADYSADDFGVDTSKLWLQATLTF